jgi:hypothetical protein
MSGIKTVLDKIKITEQGGNPIYVLPEGTTIYNGSKTDAGFEDRSTFFAFKKEVADKYGNVTSSYKTKIPLNLVALMELTLEDPLYINASPDMKTKLKNRFSVGKDEKERYTDNDQDHEIVDYVCTQYYDGYAMSGHYKGDIKFGDYFDPEMALCHPTSDNIILEETFKIDKTKSGEPPRIERKKSKKPRKTTYNEPPPPPPFGSNNSIVTPPSTPPPKSLFGSLFGFNNHITPPTTPNPTTPQVLSTPSPQKRKSMFNNNNNNSPVGGKRKTKKRKSKRKNTKMQGNKKQTKRVTRK